LEKDIEDKNNEEPKDEGDSGDSGDEKGNEGKSDKLDEKDNPKEGKKGEKDNKQGEQKGKPQKGDKGENDPNKIFADEYDKAEKKVPNAVPSRVKSSGVKVSPTIPRTPEIPIIKLLAIYHNAKIFIILCASFKES